MLEAESSSPAAGSRKSQGPNRSMNGSNQHLMRINPRRMERSTLVEVPSTHSIKGRRLGRQEGATAEKAVPSSVPLFDGSRW
jgi:hypothetical protein